MKQSSYSSYYTFPHAFFTQIIFLYRISYNTFIYVFNISHFLYILYALLPLFFSMHMIRYSVFNVQGQIFATSCAHPFERIPKRLSKSRLILKGTTSFHSSEPLLASFLLMSSGVSLSFFAIHSSSSSRWNCLFAFDHSSFVIFALFIYCSVPFCDCSLLVHPHYKDFIPHDCALTVLDAYRAFLFLYRFPCSCHLLLFMYTPLYKIKD